MFSLLFPVEKASQWYGGKKRSNSSKQGGPFPLRSLSCLSILSLSHFFFFWSSVNISSSQGLCPSCSEYTLKRPVFPSVIRIASVCPIDGAFLILGIGHSVFLVLRRLLWLAFSIPATLLLPSENSASSVATTLSLQFLSFKLFLPPAVPSGT